MRVSVLHLVLIHHLDLNELLLSLYRLVKTYQESDHLLGSSNISINLLLKQNLLSPHDLKMLRFSTKS
jgi:hypothetical protein